MTQEPRVSITVSVPLSTYATIKTLSKNTRRSMNDFLGGVVENYLEMEGVKRYRIVSEEDIQKLREKIREEMQNEKQLELVL